MVNITVYGSSKADLAKKVNQKKREGFSPCGEVTLVVLQQWAIDVYETGIPNLKPGQTIYYQQMNKLD